MTRKTFYGMIVDVVYKQHDSGWYILSYLLYEHILEDSENFGTLSVLKAVHNSIVIFTSSILVESFRVGDKHGLCKH